MANIKKNFNFRNGVQVDDDNLLVTATGLVGIGTTIPVEMLLMSEVMLLLLVLQVQHHKM